MKSYPILIKEIRFRNNENMGDMARWLGVSLPFVSAVESGRKNIPDSWAEKIIAHYDLQGQNAKELEWAIIEHNKDLRIDTSKANEKQRELALEFYKNFGTLSEEKIDEIIQILGGK